MEEIIGVIGLGYVGLPIALALSKRYETIGFDIDGDRVEELKRGIDRSGEIKDAFVNCGINFTTDPSALKAATFYIVAVPTPITKENVPYLNYVVDASVQLGNVISPGDTIVFESTVYPGVTENICGEMIEEISELKSGKDFFLGYSPERINPGDEEHTLYNTRKIVSGQTPEALDQIAKVYQSVLDAPIHKASSIQVAEMAKAVENAQRDVNIAFMNEIAMMCDSFGLKTSEVLEACRTKWNFLDFFPGRPSGHCISIDPYYLIAKSKSLGYPASLLRSARLLNEEIPSFIAGKINSYCTKNQIHSPRIGILGFSFKENVTDCRNSGVGKLVVELNYLDMEGIVHCPLSNVEEAYQEHKVFLSPFKELTDLDVLVYAVPHDEFEQMERHELLQGLKAGGLLVDLRSRLGSCSRYKYWSL